MSADGKLIVLDHTFQGESTCDRYSSPQAAPRANPGNAAYFNPHRPGHGRALGPDNL